jgi:hypothetical protein
LGIKPEDIISLINALLKLKLLRKERKFLNYALNIFKKGKTVKIEDYATLLGYSFLAIIERLEDMERQMVHLMKASKLKTTKKDDEYLFALQNILSQAHEVVDDIKKERPNLNLQRKAQQVYKNVQEMVINASYGNDIEELSNAILYSQKVDFTYNNKILA